MREAGLLQKGSAAPAAREKGEKSGGEKTQLFRVFHAECVRVRTH